MPRQSPQRDTELSVKAAAVTNDCLEAICLHLFLFYYFFKPRFYKSLDILKTYKIVRHTLIKKVDFYNRNFRMFFISVLCTKYKKYQNWRGDQKIIDI